MPAENSIAIGRIGGGLLALAGVWHTTAPWVLGYADIRTATGNAVASGLMLAVLGSLRAAAAGTWAVSACAFVGVGILTAPLVFGFDGPARDEGAWVGFLVGLTALGNLIGCPVGAEPTVPPRAAVPHGNEFKSP